MYLKCVEMYPINEYEIFGIFLRMLIWLKLWTLHYEKPGQDVNEYPLHPWGHLVGLRRTEVHV